MSNVPWQTLARTMLALSQSNVSKCMNEPVWRDRTILGSPKLLAALQMLSKLCGSNTMFLVSPNTVVGVEGVLYSTSVFISSTSEQWRVSRTFCFLWDKFTIVGKDVKYALSNAYITISQALFIILISTFVFNCHVILGTDRSRDSWYWLGTWFWVLIGC